MNQTLQSKAASAATIAPQSERLHALDAVRGFALLLGIAFHATMSFLASPQPLWLVVDKSPSTTLTILFFVSHIFRMATFFLIAGFFAHLMFHRRGERGFIRDRLRRIGLPLVVGWPILLAAIIACAAWGAFVMTGKVPEAPPADPNAPPLAFPLTHLWFLYVLLWFYTMTVLTRRLVERLDTRGVGRARLDRLVSGLVNAPYGVAVLALPTGLGLLAFSAWRPWFGIPTPDGSLLPNIAALVAFGSAFAFGWMLHRQTHLLDVIQRRWPLHVAVATAATVGCLVQLGLTPNLDIAMHDAGTYAYAAMYALAVWTWTFGLIGLALRYLSNYSATRRYIADASYWLYLIHLPIVLALQIAVSQYAWPWPIKYALILGVAFPIMLVSYRYCVRSTFVGAVLNGRRYPRTRRDDNATNAARLEGAG
jgi:glucan biosynthesis protein C